MSSNTNKPADANQTGLDKKGKTVYTTRDAHLKEILVRLGSDELISAKLCHDLINKIGLREV